MKIKKEKFQKLILIVYLLSAFLLSTGFLIATSKASNIIEGKITFLGNQKQDKVKPIISNVAGAENEEVVNIVDKKLPHPKISARAALVEDFESGTILYQKNIFDPLPPASTTKIMTALIASEHFKPGDVLTVPSEALVGGSSMGAVAGERLSFRSLLYGMMLNSGNDAAYTIAWNFPGGVGAFIDRMNQKASELGLKNTHFENPAGFDSSNHFSSASDLAKLAKIVAEDYQMAKVVSTKETSVASWDKTNQHILKNLNKLLEEDGVVGIKTGYTENAKENLVGLIERDGHKILTVILNSDDRFGETKTLIDWVEQNYSWVKN